MSDNLRLVVSILPWTKKNNAASKRGDFDTNNAYTQKAKGTSAWQALQNLKYDNGEVVFNETEIKKISKHVGKPQKNGELDLTDAIKKAGYGERLEKLAAQDQGLENNPFNVETTSSLEPVQQNPFMANNDVPEHIVKQQSNIEAQLTYNDNKLNNLFVAAYTVIDDETELTVKIDGKNLTATKAEILNMLAEDGSISAEEQKAFIKAARDVAKKSYSEDGENQSMKKGSQNQQEYIDAFNHLPAEDFYFGRGKQSKFSKNYLETNQRNAQLSARRVLTKLDDRELNKIADNSKKEAISINIEPKAVETVELNNQEMQKCKATVAQIATDILPQDLDWSALKGTKTGNDVVITNNNNSLKITLSFNGDKCNYCQIILDTQNPKEYTEFYYDKNSGELLTQTTSMLNGTRQDVTSIIYSENKEINETYIDGKLVEISESKIGAEEVDVLKNYTYLEDGSKVEVIYDETGTTVNKFDKNEKLVETYTLNNIDGDGAEGRYKKSINGKDVVILSGLTDDSVNTFISKIPASILEKVPFAQSGDLRIIDIITPQIFGLITPEENAKWSIELSKDGTFNIQLLDKPNMYTFNANGELIKKEPADAVDLETIFPKPEVEKPAPVPVAAEPTAKPTPVEIDYAAQLQYNKNDLNNLFVSSYKMIPDDTKLTINIDGKKTTGTKKELLELIAKDGKITKEEQKAFILAARAAAKASYNEDGKHRNLKKGEKNTKEDVEVFTKLPLKQFYNLKASFISSVENNERNALVTARRSLTELSDKELNNIANKAGDASITIQIETKATPAEEPAPDLQPTAKVEPTKTETQVDPSSAETTSDKQVSKVTVSTLDELVELYDAEISAKYPTKKDMPDPRKDYAAFRSYFVQFKYDSNMHIPKTADKITQEADGTYIIEGESKKVIIKPNATLTVYFADELLCKCYPPETITTFGKQKYKEELYNEAQTWANANPDKVEFIENNETPVSNQPEPKPTPTPVAEPPAPTANPAPVEQPVTETPSTTSETEEKDTPVPQETYIEIMKSIAQNNGDDCYLIVSDAIDINNCKIEEKDGEYILTSTTEKDFGGYKAFAKVIVGSDGTVSVYHGDKLAQQFTSNTTEKKDIPNPKEDYFQFGRYLTNNNGQNCYLIVSDAIDINNCKIEEKDGEYILTSNNEKDFGEYKAVVKVVIGTDGIVSIYHDDELAHQFMPDKTDKKYDITQKMVEQDKATTAPKNLDANKTTVANPESPTTNPTDTTFLQPKTEIVENGKHKKVITIDETKGTIVIERYTNNILGSKSTANISEYDEETKEVRDTLEHIHYLYLDDGSRIEGIRTKKEETVKVIDKNGNTILTDTFAINPGYSTVDFKISFAGKDLKIASTFDEESSKKILEKTPQELLNLLGDNFEIMLGAMPGYGFGGNSTQILAVNPHTNTYEITIFNEDSEFVYTYENGKITKKEPQNAPDLVLNNTQAQEMSQMFPPENQPKDIPTEHASTTSQPDSLFSITTPIQIKQDNEYPVLADMPKPTEDFEKFLEYMKGKHPELVERINSKIKARLNSEKTIADVVRITEKDGVYEIVIDNDSQHPITVHANGIVTYKDYFNNTSKYYPDGGEAYIEKDGKMTSHITPNFDTSLYYPENKQTDDGIVIGKIETVRKRLPNGNIRIIQALEYAQDGTLLAQYDYDQENPKKITKTIYKDGKAVEQKTYLNGYKGHPETITLIKDDGTQVKTRYIMVTNPNQGSKKGEILKAEETVLKNGVETTTTYKQKTQEFISLVEAGKFAEAEKLAEELINERWQIESFKSDRDDNMVIVEGRSVNSAWRTLDEGLDGTLTADRDIKVVKQGLEELQAIMASGGIITKKKLTPEEIIAHYTPTIQAACVELTQLIQDGASLEDIKKSDAYKKIIKYTNYPYLLSFDIPMDTTPQIEKAWKLILSGDQYYKMPDGINALKEVKKFNPYISIGIDMTQEEKDNVSLISGGTANDFVKDLSECEDIDAILNSESFTRLMNIGKHLGNVDFSVGNNAGVVFAPLTVGNQTYDINWLETTYNQLEAAINNKEETTIKTILTELIKAHKFGVPIDLSGSKEYSVKYATLYTMGDDQLDDAKEKYSETTWYGSSTALSKYDDHIETFNSNENRDQALSAIGLSPNSASDIGVLARGLMEYPAKSSEFATGIFIINSKEYIDKINQLLRSLGVENGNPNPLAVWCQRSGNPDLLRHLGQYDPYFKALHEKTIIRKPIAAKQ